jgi:hypothetical protein
MTPRLLATTPVFIALLAALATGPAGAEEFADRAGSTMLNVKLGATVFAGDNHGLYMEAWTFSLGFDLGRAVTRDRRGYLLIAPQIELRRGPTFTTRSPGNPVFQIPITLTQIAVSIPVGFQYDIRVGRVRDLFVYPQALLGYTAWMYWLSDATFTPSGSHLAVHHRGMAALALGLKYVVRRRINIGMEPIGLVLFFDERGATPTYRALVYAGIDF